MMMIMIIDDDSYVDDHKASSSPRTLMNLFAWSFSLSLFLSKFFHQWHQGIHNTFVLVRLVFCTLFTVEPPPKYEDIARHGWKPEDRSQQEHNSQHRTATRAEIFTITLPGRSVNSERGFASGRDIVIHRGAPREEEQGSERESRGRSCPLTNHPLERGIIASSGGICQIE